MISCYMAVDNSVKPEDYIILQLILKINLDKTTPKMNGTSKIISTS